MDDDVPHAPEGEPHLTSTPPAWPPHVRVEWMSSDHDSGPSAPPELPEPPPIEVWRAVGDVRPWGTMLVLLAWGGVFALQGALGEFGDATAEIARGASLAERDALDVAPRLLASTFLHQSASHVFFNALALLVLGQAVEWVFARPAFWIVFAFGGATASLASVLWHLAHSGPGTHISLGGSGAVFALGGALLSGAWRLRHRLAVGRSRALAAVVLMLTLPGIAAGFQTQGTDNAAHTAGFAAGLLLGAFVPLNPALSGRPSGVASRVCGVIGALALAAALVRVLAG